MKQNIVDKVILFYKFWSAALIAVAIFIADYRAEAFFTWVVATALLMVYLIINILYLDHLKKKLYEERLKEIICERNERLSRRAAKMGNHKEDKL